ncbi:hypothetical protein C9F11_12935 [Streptomyces sp. YIM 121038]|uniref:hypothetical protein n=1 Tax=unclassified Streptomyces TaxID=2593676 RepID=UPI001161D47E|nr:MULTISPECIES: hypothetical protein [unclassified Streptomyces]QCX76264.1 hypothetical protein C9F11_12935 [Streptomyces sp. YIM 121038]
MTTDTTTDTMVDPRYAEGDEETGHGRHRGPGAAHDEEAAPSGRHRRQGPEA